VLYAGDMERVDRASDYFEWDAATWSKAVPFWRRHSRIDLSKAKVLEVGGRNGGLSLWFAEQGADVTCSDLGGPSDQAMRLHRENGVAERVHYADIDATAIPYDREFDVVVFKSVLGGVGAAKGIDGQRAAILSMVKSLKPGGELMFAENLSGPRIVRALRRQFVPWGGRWLYPSEEQMIDMLSGFEHCNFSAAGTVALLGRSESQRAMLHRLDAAILDRLGTRRARYVLFGIARK
jgi:SAM-dependent methyltransferase